MQTQTNARALLLQKPFAPPHRGKLAVNRPVYHCGLQPVRVNGSAKRARRGVFAWGEDKCGELGKTRGERWADAFRAGLGLFIHTLTEERWSKLHAQTSVAEIREGKRDRGLGQTCAEVCFSSKGSVFIKQVSSDLRVFYITCLHSPLHRGTAGTCSHVLIRNRQLCVTKHLSSSRGPMCWTAWATYVYVEPHRFHSSQACMNIFKLKLWLLWPSIDNGSAHSGLQLNQYRDNTVLVCSRKSTCSRLVISLFLSIPPTPVETCN